MLMLRRSWLAASALLISLAASGSGPTGPQYHQARETERPGSICLSDMGFPLEVELEAAPLARPGEAGTALLEVRPRAAAERIEIEIRPSSGVEIVGERRIERVAIGPRGTGPIPVAARLMAGAVHGTVDLVATAWIDGAPLQRGITWNLVTTEPEPGRVIERPGGLAVREHRVGRDGR